LIGKEGFSDKLSVEKKECRRWEGEKMRRWEWLVLASRCFSSGAVAKIMNVEDRRSNLGGKTLIRTEQRGLRAELNRKWPV
jgi:hypothetical protein